MIGVQAVGVYIPETRVSNYGRRGQFDLDDYFIEEKLGVAQVAVKDTSEKASDLALHAFKALSQKAGLGEAAVQCLVVVTQNPDYNLPHTSAIVHGKLDLSPRCACFDVSLGCSGFVYGLALIETFMERNDFEHGVLITADPYSAILDHKDKNTALLFGDAATATLVSRRPAFVSGKYTFGTMGSGSEELICRNGVLSMRGRSVFDFAVRQVPADIKLLLEKNCAGLNQVDRFLFHQGSKYMHQSIVARLNIDPERAPFAAREYGNTVSSSIPIMLEKELEDTNVNTIVISGFGVGFSWASGILWRTDRARHENS